jgi:hypothetical protein
VTSFFAAVLLGHGLAHLVGFAAPWRMADPEGVTFQAALFDGRVPVTQRTMRVVGIGWLVLALGFGAAGTGAAGGLSWWIPAAQVVALASLVMCVMNWPAARIGAAVNVVLLIVLEIGHAALWF